MTAWKRRIAVLLFAFALHERTKLENAGVLGINGGKGLEQTGGFGKRLRGQMRAGLGELLLFVLLRLIRAGSFQNEEGVSTLASYSRP